MKKQLISGNFSSIPLATLIASTLDIAPEDEIRDDDSPGEDNQAAEQEPPEAH
ncbi:MAG: hypothetical protein P4N41_07015 [Negativicutes bacterium]|nr:hypothetical protein [Negativicutes bacterium]